MQSASQTSHHYLSHNEDLLFTEDVFIFIPREYSNSFSHGWANFSFIFIKVCVLGELYPVLGEGGWLGRDYDGALTRGKPQKEMKDMLGRKMASKQSNKTANNANPTPQWHSSGENGNGKGVSMKLRGRSSADRKQLRVIKRTQTRIYPPTHG